MNGMPTLYCIHGFLGLPSDWDFLKSGDRAVRIERVDAWRVLSPASGAPMTDWARAFNEAAAAQPGPRVLMGYSMGGRLALHALTRNPSLWDAAVIISTHPGLPEAEREARTEADELWAKRFEKEEWNSLVQAWETLPVFGGRPLPFTRRGQDFRRADLAGALRAWSTGRQQDLAPRIPELPMPLLWIAGQDDLRYVRVGQKILSQVQAEGRPDAFELWIAPQAAHRVPWESSEAFQKQLWSFLDRVSSKRALEPASS